jgi:hypothetical protein
MEEKTLDQSSQLMFKQPLPNSTAVLVLGILSIVFCWCYGIVGIIMGVIALVLASKSQRLYEQDPDKWTGYSNLQARRITAIVGLVFSALLIIFAIIAILYEGLDLGYDFLEEFYDF